MSSPRELSASCEARLRSLARRMLARFPTVRRWDETDDIFQEASLRFHHALCEVAPQSELHFHRLFALQLRRVLLDLARRYSSPSHFAANYDTQADGGDQPLMTAANRAESSDPLSLEAWAELHRCAAELPLPLRDVFDLLWYGGVNQEKAADLLGIQLRSLERRWRKARYLLSRQLDGGIMA